jgi:hypothetical protein
VSGGGWGPGGEMNQALYAHMNNKRKMKQKTKNKKQNQNVLSIKTNNCFKIFT